MTYSDSTWKFWDSKTGLLLLLNPVFSSFKENELIYLTTPSPNPTAPAPHPLTQSFHPSSWKSILVCLWKPPFHSQSLWFRYCQHPYFRGTHMTQALSVTALHPPEIIQPSSSSSSTFSEHLACARHCSKSFPCIISFNLHNNPWCKHYYFCYILHEETKGISNPKPICLTTPLHCPLPIGHHLPKKQLRRSTGTNYSCVCRVTQSHHLK